MHVPADDLPGRAHIASLDVAARYGVEPPRPKLDPWVQVVAYVFDPPGILWHFAEPSRTG